MKLIAKTLYDYIKGINGILLILYFCFVFFTNIIISEYFSKVYVIVSIFFVLALSIVLCPFLISRISKLKISCRSEHNLSDCNSKKSKIGLYLIPFIILLFYYFAYYPGGFSPDSIDQYAQVLNQKYNDWHPVIQTLFSFTLPLVLTGGWTGSIVLFQIICFSLVLGYAFNIISMHTNRYYTVASISFVLLNPQLGYMAMYPWKDVSFSIGALLLMTFCLQIFFTKGKWIYSLQHLASFSITAALTTLFRHNGLFFTIPLVLAVVLFVSRKRGFMICLCIIIICAGIKIPLYSVIGVEKRENTLVETLGVPMNVIGASVTYTPEEVEKDVLEFAYKIAPKEVWEEKYKYGSYNYVKWDERTNNSIIEEYGLERVLGMMFSCIKNSKIVSLRALIKLTEATFTIYDNYDSFKKPYIIENEIGLVQIGNQYASSLCDSYRNFVSDFLSYSFLHLGLIHILLIVSILSKCKLNRWRDWKKIFFIFPVIIYNFGTTLLLTGIDDATRFFFYSYLLLPILLIFIYRIDDERGMDSKVQIKV